MLGSIKTKITVYVCPDKVCQKGVEKKIAEKEERRLNFINRSRQRANNRIKAKKKWSKTPYGYSVQLEQVHDIEEINAFCISCRNPIEEKYDLCYSCNSQFKIDQKSLNFAY